MRKFTRSTPLIALFAFHLKFDVLRGAKRNRLLIYSVTVLLTEPFSSRLRAAFCLVELSAIYSDVYYGASRRFAIARRRRFLSLNEPASYSISTST